MAPNPAGPDSWNRFWALCSAWTQSWNCSCGPVRRIKTCQVTIFLLRKHARKSGAASPSLIRSSTTVPVCSQAHGSTWRWLEVVVDQPGGGARKEEASRLLTSLPPCTHMDLEVCGGGGRCMSKWERSPRQSSCLGLLLAHSSPSPCAPKPMVLGAHWGGSGGGQAR